MSNTAKCNIPQVMGIINMSPDSFYSGSRCLSEDDFARKCEQMLEEGADIIDIGGCSTRPGSQPVAEECEWEALKPALKNILWQFPACSFSIDTFRASIVERAYDIVGDFIINDISAGEDDEKMLSMAGKLELPYIAMHKRGTPKTMSSMTQYKDIVEDIRTYFFKFIREAKDYGIKEIILDPGFGFAKTLDQNYTLLNYLDSFKIKDEKQVAYPLIAGLSRKGMIWKLLSISPEEALPATTALNLQALLNGADILRVHDVKEARQIIEIYNKIIENK